MAKLLNYPHPANEVVGRLVAGMTTLVTILVIVLNQKWLLLYLTYEFLARVLAGPRFSLMARLARHVLVPALGLPKKLVPGPPKHFAQFVGLLFAGSASVLWMPLAQITAAKAVLGVLACFAVLESVFGICAGCFMFSQLMRLGWIPQSVCEECVNWRPPAQAAMPKK